MRPFFVIGSYPVAGDIAHLIEIGEHVGVQHFRSIRLVEPFDERILVRFSRLDVSKFHTVLLAPVHQRLRDELRTVVHAQCPGCATPLGQLLERSHNTAAWDRGVDDDVQHFSNPVVQDVQHAEALSTEQHIAHEVE
jgi:hypothetical protein